MRMPETAKGRPTRRPKKMVEIDPYFLAGAVLIALLALAILVSVFYTPYDPNAIVPAARFQPPSPRHLFGTDHFGRDIFSRVLVGMRFTFFVALGTVLGSALVGAAAGVAAGYFGGAFDLVVMRLNDALTAFPGILLALVLVTVLGQGRYTIVLALGIIFTPSFSRVVRGETLRLREQEFVRSAVVFGASPLRVMLLHIFPSVWPTLLSAMTIGFSNAVLAESGMSYLGFGIQPPDPSLGRMLSEAQSYLFTAPWYAVFPGLAILAAVLGFGFAGEGARRQFGV